MNVTLNKKDDINGVISIELRKEDYQEKVDKSLKKFRNRANIPGFRQGKVPMGVVKKMYGKSVLLEEINKLLSENLSNHIRENQLQILGEPIPQNDVENRVDFDKDENFTFKFDIGLTPEFELPLSQKDKITYYNVSLEDDLLQKQMDAYIQNYGTYESVDETAKDTDLLKGILTELDEEKEQRVIVEDAVLMISYIKDKKEKKKFADAKKGDTITFSPSKAYEGHEAELSSLMQIGKEDVLQHTGDFSFKVKDVTRFKEAEMNQELFDKVLGEGEVKTEEEFKEKIKASLEEQFKPNSDYKFSMDARKLLLKKMKDTQFPDEFLKRWLTESNEEKSAEDIEKEYPKIIEDLKFHLAKEKIVRAQDFKVEQEEIEVLAEKVARSQFAQYGMTNLPADTLQSYVKTLLEKEETVRNFADRIIEDKVMVWIKTQIKIDEKAIVSEAFTKMLEEEDKKNDATTKKVAVKEKKTVKEEN